MCAPSFKARSKKRLADSLAGMNTIFLRPNILGTAFAGACLGLLWLAACGGESQGSGGASSSGGQGGQMAQGGSGQGGQIAQGGAGQGGSGQGGGSAIYQPKPLSSWQWQLSGSPIDTSIDVEMYDIDLFVTTDAEFTKLHADGRKIICYFSAGSFENDRPDSAQFPENVKGKVLDGWPDEKWIDIRSPVVRDLMKARLDVAKMRGCDGVEPDNVDGYSNDNGLGLSASDQLDYNIFIASEAHARGLSVGLKNDLEQLNELAPHFDWALNEECYTYQECDLYSEPFIAAGKAVFHAEYVNASALSQVCGVTLPLKLSTLIKNLDLDAYRLPCP